MHVCNEADLIIIVVIRVVIPTSVHPVLHASVVAFMGKVSWSLSVTLFARISRAVPFNMPNLVATITFLLVSGVRPGRWTWGSKGNGHEYVWYFRGRYKGGVIGDYFGGVSVDRLSQYSGQGGGRGNVFL